MYIRWTLKKSPAPTSKNARRGGILIAQLAECNRIDGKPRQKIIAYLGSIPLLHIKNAREQLTFWRHAQAAFKKAGLTNAQKHQVDALLQKRVGKPSPEAIQTIDYLKDKQHFIDQIPKDVRWGMTDKQLADTIRKYEASSEFREKENFDSMLSGWIAMFPSALKGMSGKEREELLAMYKELTGKEYAS